MICQGNRYDGKVLDVREEIRASKGIVYHTCTPPMGLASKEVGGWKAREAVQDYQLVRLPHLQKVFPVGYGGAQAIF